jgi:hypothetical protein
MIKVPKARNDQARPSALAYPGMEKRLRSGKMIYWQAYSAKHQLLTAACSSETVFFERTTHECY